MNSSVDLHCHSIASDGTFTPREVVKLAKESGLSGLALTDHDTIAGIAEATTAAREFDIDFIPGIEISCVSPRPSTIHLLGYGIDPMSPNLVTLTSTLIDGRNRRNERMVQKMNALGLPVTLDEFRAEAGGDVIGRPHMAAVLVRKNIVSNMAEAFNLYLGTGGKVWVDKEQLTAREAIDLIHRSGGLAVLAHPTQLRKNNDAQLQSAIKNLVDLGLDGLEVIHSDHRDRFIDRAMEIAAHYNLLMTGGSDFHGSNKKHIRLGFARDRRVPRAMFDALLARLLKVEC